LDNLAVLPNEWVPAVDEAGNVLQDTGLKNQLGPAEMMRLIRGVFGPAIEDFEGDIQLGNTTRLPYGSTGRLGSMSVQDLRIPRSWFDR
jgi:hypothetical protein